MSDHDVLLKTAEAAKRLGVAKRTMEDWRVDKIGPPYVRVGRRLIRYRASDLAEYVNSSPDALGTADQETELAG